MSAAQSYIQPFGDIHWRVSSNIVLLAEGFLIVLGAFSLSFSGVDDSDQVAIQAAVLFFGAWVFACQYASRRQWMHASGIVARTWVMAAFLVWIMWYTDGLESPLRNGFLIVILASSLTTGMANTMSLLLPVAFNTVILSSDSPASELLSVSFVGEIVTRIAPQIILAYVMSLYGPEFRFMFLRARPDGDKDPSSGLLNMRGLSIFLDRLFGSMHRDSQSASALVMSIQCEGRESADLSSAQFDELFFLLAKNVDLLLRRGDVAGRFGNRAIVMILTNATVEDCAVLQDRLVQKIDLEAIARVAVISRISLVFTALDLADEGRGLVRTLNALAEMPGREGI